MKDETKKLTKVGALASIIAMLLTMGGSTIISDDPMTIIVNETGQTIKVCDDTKCEILYSDLICDDIDKHCRHAIAIK